MLPKSDIIVHLLYRFEFGGMQSLLAECICRKMDARARHVVICLADYDLAATNVLVDVELITLNRHIHGALHAHRKLFEVLRRLQPTVLHTYNIGTIEYIFTGALAGVQRRIHAEHGRGMHERLGNNKKYNLLRWVMAPLISTFVTVSDDMTTWLVETVGIPKRKVMLIRNGIDIARFHPAFLQCQYQVIQKTRFTKFIIGTVGRLDAIKAQSDLVEAFIALRYRFRDTSIQLSLVIIGEGPMQHALEEQIRAAGIEDSVWMPGARSDIAEILRTLNVFVLPSISESTPITLLEAMATGIPVVATNVGGVPDLIGETCGTLVEPSNTAALANAIDDYIREPSVARRHADAAREFVVAKYNIEITAAAYDALYSAA